MTHSSVHWLDAWLWRQGISHQVIRPLLRNVVLLSGFFLLGGALSWFLTDWFFWFGAGVGIMALTLWSLSRFFLRRGLGIYSSALLWVVLLRWLGRLIALSVILYVALVVCRAPVSAILGGLTAGTVTALVSFVLAMRKKSCSLP